MKKIKFILVLLCLFCLLFSGCMSFNGNELPEVKKPIPPKTKPVIEMKIEKWEQKLNGEGASRGVTSNKSNGYLVLKFILARWYSKDLISDYGTIGSLGKIKPDYTLTLNGFRNEDMSWLGAILCGLTLYIIPSSSTMEFNLDLALKDHKTNKTYKLDAKNSVTVWFQLFFILGLPVFWVGDYNMQYDTSMYVYHMFNEQGAFSEYY